VDGNDFIKVREIALNAVARARNAEGPSLIETKTYRIRGHFEGDPQKYRTPEEIDAWKNHNDPVQRFEDHLVESRILTDEKRRQIRDEVAAALQAAVDFAVQSPYPEPEEALDDLFVTE